MKKKIGLKNKGTIIFTNHFDLGWKENLLIKIDWDPVELSMKLLWFQRNRVPPGGLRGVIFAGYVPLTSQSS